MVLTSSTLLTYYTVFQCLLIISILKKIDKWVNCTVEKYHYNSKLIMIIIKIYIIT